jgi:hypothetical protein
VAMKALFKPTSAGPIAAVEVGMPVVVVAGSDSGSSATRVLVIPVRLQPKAMSSGHSVASSHNCCALCRATTHFSPGAKSHYVRADRIARVHDGRVELSVHLEDVDTER